MSTNAPTPGPPYEGIPIPPVYRDTPYDELPPALKRRVDNWPSRESAPPPEPPL